MKNIILYILSNNDIVKKDNKFLQEHKSISSIPYNDIYPYVNITINDNDGFGNKSSKEDEMKLEETLIKNYKTILSKYDITNIVIQKFIVHRTKIALSNETNPLEATIRSIDFYGKCLNDFTMEENKTLNLSAKTRREIYTNMRKEVLILFKLIE